MRVLKKTKPVREADPKKEDKKDPVEEALKLPEKEIFACKTDEDVLIGVAIRISGPEGSYSSAEATAACRRTFKAGENIGDLVERAEVLCRAVVPKAYQAMLREYRRAHGHPAGE